MLDVVHHAKEGFASGLYSMRLVCVRCPIRECGRRSTDRP